MAILFLILSGAVSGMTYAVFEIPILIYLSLIPFFYIIFKKAENTGVFKMYLYGLAFFYPYFIAVFHWFIYQYPLDFLGFLGMYRKMNIRTVRKRFVFFIR